MIIKIKSLACVHKIVCDEESQVAKRLKRCWTYQLNKIESQVMFIDQQGSGSRQRVSVKIRLFKIRANGVSLLTESCRAD